MSITAQTIINVARIMLNDTDSDNYRWTDATLLSLLNAAQRDIATRSHALGIRPAYTVTETLELGAGCEQNLADLSTTYTPLAVLNIDKNVGVTWVDEETWAVDDICVDPNDQNAYKCIVAHTGAGTATSPLSDSTNWVLTQEAHGSNVEHIHEANLDMLITDWHSANENDTDTDGKEIEYWSEDQRDKLRFHVYPQQPDTDYKMNVRCTYSAMPSSAGSVSTNIALNDFYQDAIREYLIAMAFAIDDEVDQNGNTNSGKWMQMYLNNGIFALR
jgi:hypothetical protein